MFLRHLPRERAPGESTIAPDGGWVGERCGRRNVSPANGLEVHLRGQGPRGYGSAAHGLPACESRDAGRAAVQLLTSPGGSAAGPKPGRDRCYLELGRATVNRYIAASRH